MAAAQHCPFLGAWLVTSLGMRRAAGRGEYPPPAASTLAEPGRLPGCLGAPLPSATTSWGQPRDAGHPQGSQQAVAQSRCQHRGVHQAPRGLPSPALMPRMGCPTHLTVPQQRQEEGTSVRAAPPHPPWSSLRLGRSVARSHHRPQGPGMSPSGSCPWACRPGRGCCPSGTCCTARRWSRGWGCCSSG